MLEQLNIRNLAVIEDTEVELGPGLNVLTGETGAGKSILIGALNLVLGDRARTDTVRAGARRAEVQALFRLSPGDPVVQRLRALDLLDPDLPEPGEGEADGAPEDGGARPLADQPVELIIRRVVSAATAGSGRSRVYINGTLSTVKTLREVTRGLVDIASQHEHTAILAPSAHLPLLDRFGGHDEVLADYAAAWEALEQARAERDALRRREEERREREDFVRFALEEIRAAAPEPGELDALTAERDRLRHAEELVEGALAAERALTGGQAAASLAVGEALRAVERLAGIDPALTSLVERLESARIEVEDVAFEARRYAERVESDPRRLQEVDDRLDLLRRLARKHGGTLEAVLERGEALQAELDAFDSLEIDTREAAARAEAALAHAQEAAAALTEARRRAADELEERVGEELASLAMTGARVRFELTPTEALTPTGGDRGELTIATNLGDDFKPLARVASGGELSRLLLALKRAFTRVDPVRLAVFDEVDTGVGGAVAEVIGEKLAQIARERQVIAITHLPQIAAKGTHHLVVDKGLVDGRARTTVRMLSASERVDELARMLGGVEITEQVRAHAAELLAGPR